MIICSLVNWIPPISQLFIIFLASQTTDGWVLTRLGMMGCLGCALRYVVSLGPQCERAKVKVHGQCSSFIGTLLAETKLDYTVTTL